jgi:hypothetical protein
MSISNIDDLLMGGVGNSQQPSTPEYQDAPEPVEEIENDVEYDDNPPVIDEAPEDESSEHQEELPKNAKEPTKETDEYGNEKEPENEAIRERLARQARKHEAEINELRAQLAAQGASREVQKAAKDFEYDPEASGDWQQQLASFVKQTVNTMTREQEQERHQQFEMEEQRKFESKFRDGMERFDDFREVISSLPCQITDAMTLATRGMENPAAFLYAAAKRNPAELERISKIRDPFAQAREMGNLEASMRRNKQTTKAPRPLGKAPEDTTITQKPKEKDRTGDDLLAGADAKRLSSVKTRLRSNR